MLARRLAPVVVASLVLPALLAACSTTASAPSVSAGVQTVACTGPREPNATRSASPWHVVKDVGSFDGADVNFAVASATDAWSTWVTTNYGPGYPKGTPQAVERWDGTAWQPVAVPANLVPHVRTSTSVASYSASDAWIFSWKWPTQALVYTDGRWSLQQIPSWVIRPEPHNRLGVTSFAFSATNLWVFSLGNDGHNDRYAAHYNGRTWTQVTLPGIPGDVSAVSASDIWALAVTAGTVGGDWTASGVMHYNGRTWSLISLPVQPVAAGSSVSYSNLTAAGPSAAWLVCTVAPEGGFPTTTLMHLSGTTWTTASFPTSDAAFLPVSMAQDGSGGLWVEGVYEDAGGFEHAFHFSGGKWALWPWLQAHGGATLAWIPGTRQDWAWDSSTIYQN